MQLFPHQSQALEKVKDHDRGVFNITCGGGKSRIIKEAALMYKISVVFAPTKNLVSQFHRDYFEGGDTFVPVVINSDNPVNETTMESVQEALETDARIVFLCNYQSLHVVQQLCVDLSVVIDIVMFDEAHNVTSKNSRGKIANMKVERNSGNDDMDVDDEYVKDSDDESDNESDETSSETNSEHVYQVDAAQVAKLQARKTFFFTATPTRVMKNHPDIYGDELIRYTYAQAVTDGVVKNVDTVIECYAADDKSCLDAGYDRLIPAINRFIVDADVSRVIIYTSHVRDSSSSKASVDGLVKNKKLFDKNIVVHAVTASTSLQARDKIFDTFRGKSKKVHVIVSCRTISEGVDLPNCDAVVILDPSRSVVTNVQRGLRACRLTPEERHRGTWDNAVVFYPINVPQQAFVDLIESTRDESTKDYLSKSIHAHSFEFAMTVVNFLKHDLELDVLFDFKCPGSSGGALTEKSCEMEQRQSTCSTLGKPVSRVTFSLDTYVTWNIDQFRESATYLSTSMNVIGLDEMWDRKYQLLREFMTVHGRTPSEKAKTKDEKVLGTWVSNRRKDYSKGKLAQGRIDQLETIPGWSWDPVQDSYDQNLTAVREFMTLHGRTPSDKAKTKDEKVLGKWASHRRTDYSKGVLAQDRVAQLESIPGWAWDPLQDSFNQRMAAVSEFMSQHGRTPSEKAKSKDEAVLGRWISSRRKDYSKGKLAQDRVAQLESIPGWSWDPLQDSYEQSLAAVHEFMTVHGRAPLQTAKTKDEKVLGVWVSVRRKDYSKGKLAQDRVAQLESIPGWSWDPFQDNFNKNLDDVREFMTVHGRAPSEMAKSKDEKVLGKWASRRRNEYSKGKLAQDRVAQLESIPGWSWDPLQDNFNQSMAAVLEFMTAHGRVPSTTAKTKDEKTLGVWVSHRRRDYSKGKLAQDRVAQLESIPGWWWAKETKPKTKSLKRSAPSSVQSDQERTTKRPRQLSTISEYHKRFKSMSSSNLHQEFLSNPQTFHDYHHVASQNWTGFNSKDIPVTQAATIFNNMYAKTKTPMQIVDFGAGLGTLKDLIDPVHVLKGFDHVSVQPWIEARDMRNTGLKEQSVDVAVFSMSLWGSNWADYIQEAFRVLKFNGYALIVDSTKRWFLDDQMQLMNSEDSRVIKCLVENKFVVSKISGLDTKFFCCVAFKPLF